MKNVSARFRLWLDIKDGKDALGDGKWRLLKTIQRKGSLASACKVLNISYRKAWGDITELQNNLKVTLIERHRGGQNGGNTSLTKEGEKIVKAYEKFHNDVEKCVQKSYKKHFRK